MKLQLSLSLGDIRSAYQSRRTSPSDVVETVYEKINAAGLAPVWISLVPRRTAVARARELERDPLAAALPLYGVPFAIKDNIDLEGVPTTAGCPAYAYIPPRSATVVQALIDAGAIPIGKTSLDQFGAGLAGTRSPQGPCSSVFDKRYISGGSSSGSAVAVASGLSTFALGTDTGGSGLIPAAFNNLVGLKPTRGTLSTAGMVPACRSLDSISILAQSCHDVYTIWQAAHGFDAADSFSRIARPGEGAAPWIAGRFRFGVPAATELEFFGDDEAAALYTTAIEGMQRLGGEKIEIDFRAFRSAGALLRKGPWIAERLAAIAPFFAEHGSEMHPLVHEYLSAAQHFSAMDAFRGEYQLSDLIRAAQSEWSRVDLLVLPTAGTIYTHADMAADPEALNQNLGYYTEFVNLMDLAAVATPAGFRASGLPYGVSLVGPAFTDEALLVLADRYHRSHTDVPGPALDDVPPPGCVLLAVVGAHLTGQPLNRQLTERGARLVRACRTARGYRLYALDRTQPPKPGLVRDDEFSGPGIEVEVWAVPEAAFGGFVAEVPAPLGIGNAQMDDGQTVKCFIVEPYAVQNATEITRFGGWRQYLSQVSSSRHRVAH